jgi:putative toxin-antitoxin system antitoxin component (TIGR02293 family)
MDVREVTKKLGGQRVLGKKVRNQTDLRRAVEGGLPVLALTTLAAYLAQGSSSEANALKHSVVPKTTLKRRTRLTQPESERTERLARLTALAEHVWEDRVLAREFLTTRQPQLDDERPIDLARSELGARQVEQLLMKMEYSLPV